MSLRTDDVQQHIEWFSRNVKNGYYSNMAGYDPLVKVQRLHLGPLLCCWLCHQKNTQTVLTVLLLGRSEQLVLFASTQINWIASS